MKNLRDESFCSEILNCHRCSARLSLEPGRLPVLGEGNDDAKLVWLGRDPGSEEDRLGRPFVGPGGKLLDEMTELLGLTRDEVGIINVKKCHPPGDLPPEIEHLEACKHWLMKELQFFKNMRVLVPLGNDAMRVVLGYDRPSILKIPLKLYNIKSGIFKDLVVYPILHPGYTLRKPGWKAWTFETALPDLRRVLVSLGVVKPILEESLGDEVVRINTNE